MKPIHYLTLGLFLLAPALALAQDSLVVDIGNATDLGAYEANFGFNYFGNEGKVIGPSPFVVVEGDGSSVPDFPEQGCDPYTPENAAEVKGNVAVIARGSCPFVLKVQHAVAAGAIAALIYVSDPESSCGGGACGDDGIVFMGGNCTADGEPPEGGCSIPAASTSLSSGMAILTEIEFGEEGTITCEVCPFVPPPPAAADIEGPTVQSTVFEDGFIGNDFSFGRGLGFTFNGEQGLFVSTVLVGIDGEVTGNPYDGASEFEAGEAIQLTPPFPAPFGDADAGARAMFSSDEVDITLSGYAFDAAIVYDMNVTNISGGDLEDVYLGLFADFDLGVVAVDDEIAGVSENENLVYIFQVFEGSAYFGIAALSETALSGYSTEATTADDDQLFEAMTTEVEPGADPSERAVVIGVGPFDIAEGETKIVRLAMVAGEDEADIIANTQELICIDCFPSVEGETSEGIYILESVYPNPLSSEATVGFTLPVAQVVRVAVYDVLGREVAVLAEGVRPAGAQAVTFDASGLGSGMYVVRLEAGAVQLTQRLTVVR